MMAYLGRHGHAGAAVRAPNATLLATVVVALLVAVAALGTEIVWREPRTQ